jgi:hypothetical protein
MRIKASESTKAGSIGLPSVAMADATDIKPSRSPAYPEYLNTTEAADLLRVAVSTLAKMRCIGLGGPAYIKVGRKVLYERAELASWLDARRHRSTSDYVLGLKP